MRKLTLLATAIGAIIAGAANATIITQTFSITATGFGTGAPYATVTGSFSVTFDNSSSRATGSSEGLTVLSYSLPSAPTDFAYSAAGDQLVIGFGTSVPAAGATACSLSQSQSCLKLRQVSTTPIGTSFSYNIDGVRTGQVIVTSQTATALPEPAGWAMMLVGFGAVGLAMRRREVKVGLV